jgi:RNA polymerase sigma-70 factor (ECF subfamily)
MSGEQGRRDAATLERDPVEFERAFRDHHAMVFRTAWRITGNAEDAEDVMQTVFLRLLRREESSGEVANLESFLRRAAVNGALDVLRARASAGAVGIETAAPLASAGPAGAPDRVAASSEIRRWLRQAVARLGGQAGEVFALRFFEGRDNSEIAEVVGTTPATIAVTLHRTRERLEREYRAWTEGGHHG